MPMIDGITLTDTMTHLYKAGKIVDVPVIVGSMNDEGAQFEAHSNTTLSVATNKVWNLTDSQVAEAITYYPVNATFGSASPDNFFLTEFHAYISSLSQFGEQSCAASERMIGRYMSEKFGSDRIWAFRYNAPGKSLVLLLSSNPATALTWNQLSGPTSKVVTILSPMSRILQRTLISRLLLQT